MKLFNSNTRQLARSFRKVVDDKPSVGGFLYFMAHKKTNWEEKFYPGVSPNTEKMVGLKYGRLLVLEYLGNRVSPNGFKSPMILCKCDCGSKHIFIASKVRTGYSTSCGCFQSENSSKIHTKHGQKANKYGKRGTIMYARWRSMFDRVRNDSKYKNVIISERWVGEKGFINFCNDMGPMPTSKHTVDRYPICNGDYTPENTRWATMKQQAQNTTKNRNFLYNGEVLCMSEIARRNGLTPRELNRRINVLNLTLVEALEYVVNKKKKPHDKAAKRIN